MAPSNRTTQPTLAGLVTHVFTEVAGRGPTHARAYQHEQLATVVLQNPLTQIERQLACRGEHEIVRSVRRAYHAAMRSQLASGAEQVLGRPVICVLIADHLVPELTIVSFVLPADAEADPRP